MMIMILWIIFYFWTSRLQYSGRNFAITFAFIRDSVGRISADFFCRTALCKPILLNTEYWLLWQRIMYQDATRPVSKAHRYCIKPAREKSNNFLVNCRSSSFLWKNSHEKSGAATMAVAKAMVMMSLVFLVLVCRELMLYSGSGNT